MVANESKVRILRGQEDGSAWQIVCADCGPLETVADEAGGMNVGRAHLLRVHDGGGLAVDIGPYRAVGPRRDAKPRRADDAEGRATLDALASWLERQGPLPTDSSGLDRLGRALLASRDELERDAVADEVVVAKAPPVWSGWRPRRAG
jgi:hypothetical protein